MIIIVKQRVITAKHFLNVYAIKNSVQRKKRERRKKKKETKKLDHRPYIPNFEK